MDDTITIRISPLDAAYILYALHWAEAKPVRDAADRFAEQCLNSIVATIAERQVADSSEHAPIPYHLAEPETEHAPRAVTTALRIAHPSGEGPVLHSWLTTTGVETTEDGRTARTFYAAELMERVRAVMGRDASEALAFTVETVIH